MPEKLTNEVLEYLRLCGLSEKKIGKCDLDTRLYHDLGYYGDVAEANMELLESRFHVDLTDFRFDQYFPSEYWGENYAAKIINWAVPFVGAKNRGRQTYPPITLEMIGNVIRQKKWI